MHVIAQTTSLVLAAVLAAACSKDPNAAGTALGERHAEALERREITLDELDEALHRAEENLEGAELEAFRGAYREAIEPAKDDLAELYVRKAADEIERAGSEVGKSLGGFFRGLADAVEEEVKAPDTDDHRRRMKDLGRHLGRFVRNLEDSVRAAAEGLEEELRDRQRD